MRPDQIVLLALDELSNAKYRNPFELDFYLKIQIEGKEKTCLSIDEIQYVEDIQNPYVDNPKARITFVDVVLGLMKIPNVDIYIAGSNSRMLSSDTLTQFRDHGDEIRVFPTFLC